MFTTVYYLATAWLGETEQVSFKKEVGVMVNDLVFWLTVWYKTKFGSQNLATKFGNHLCMATKIGSQC